MLRFGLRAVFPANWLARLCFRGERARALFAGCAAHSMLPLSQPFTAALGLLFAITAHVEDWPVARGGSRAISQALASYLRSLGGAIETSRRIGASTSFRRRASCSSTPRPSSSPRSRATRCRRATAAGSRATATAPACSSSTGRSADRSRGAIPRAARRRRCTWAARSRRSARRSATCTAAATPSGRS